MIPDVPLETYLDVMGRPPRVGSFASAKLRARVLETEWGKLPVVHPIDLVVLKKTRPAPGGRSGKLRAVDGVRDDSRPQASVEIYDENGVDRTLVRACLRETPLERLEALEEMHQLAESVKRVGKQVPPVD